IALPRSRYSRCQRTLSVTPLLDSAVRPLRLNAIVTAWKSTLRGAIGGSGERKAAAPLGSTPCTSVARGWTSSGQSVPGRGNGVLAVWPSTSTANELGAALVTSNRTATPVAVRTATRARSQPQGRPNGVKLIPAWAVAVAASDRAARNREAD